MTPFEIAALIQENFIGECTATQGYSDFIAKLKADENYATDKNLQGLVDALTEIISDETQHQEVLHAWFKKISGIKPATN